MNNLPQKNVEKVATDSHVAMLKGAISLAWIDGKLHPEEIERLQIFVNNNINMNNAQKQQLHAAIHEQQMLEDIWGDIEDLQDRAHLINIATLIFWEDMNFCDAEKAMFETMQKRHIEFLPKAEVENDLAIMAAAARKNWREEENALHSDMSFVQRLLSYLHNAVS
jgi:hypothetical protein